MDVGDTARVRARTGVDAVSVLTAYLVLLVALPSRLVIGPLGGAGSPAVLAGLGCLIWWGYSQVRRPLPSRQGRQPVRTAALLLLACVTVSYIVAMTRAIDPEESSTAQLGLLVLLSWLGVLLFANDGIPSPARLDTFLRRLVFAGGFEATVGIAQFFTGQTLVDRIHVPGLTATQALGSITARGGFDRPPGTTLHAIEFGAVLAMALPIAVNTALNDRSRNALRRWYPVGAIYLAAVLAISRSSLICVALGSILIAVAWTPQVRRVAGAAFVVFAALIFVTIPGMLGTLTGLFTGISSDSSALSRVGSYAIAGEFIDRSPWFGRGFSTFLPKYRILDNQYLGLLIEIGFVGVVAFLGLLVTAMVCSRMVRSVSTNTHRQQLGQALMASVASGALGLAFYDGLGFPIAGGFLFLVVGVAGAQWRIVRVAARRPRRVAVA